MSIQTRTSGIQNEIVRLYFTFQRDGVFFPPANQPLVEIIDTDGVTLIDTVNAQAESNGVYFADWYVPANLPLGDYYDRWTYQWDASASVNETTSIFSVFSLDTYINSVSKAISHSVSTKAFQLSNDLSNDFIYEAMHIDTYWEQGMRVQQENQAKRVKKYYYFTLDADVYAIDKEAVYFNNNQRFTVFEYVTPFYSSSSSSSQTESESSSSSSSLDSSSSSSSDLSSASSESASNVSSSSSSSSSEAVTTTTTTPDWSYSPILTCVGTGAPDASGTLMKISGVGPDQINFVNVSEKTSSFSTKYNFAYQNWNRDPRPIVRVNNRIVDDGWHADYNGNIYFDGLMTPEDSINAAFHFAYFSQEEILSFLNLGLKMMNTVPPASETYSNLTLMPREWDAPVLLYAAITALKRLIFGLNFQEKAIIFGKPDEFARTQSAIDNFKALYADYSETWTEVKKDVKTRKLPGIAMYVTPEYTLPGGRSRWFRYLYKSGADG